MHRSDSVCLKSVHDKFHREECVARLLYYPRHCYLCGDYQGECLLYLYYHENKLPGSIFSCFQNPLHQQLSFVDLFIPKIVHNYIVIFQMNLYHLLYIHNYHYLLNIDHFSLYDHHFQNN